MRIVTITSKRQITIPASFFKRLGLGKGQKLIVSQEGESIKIEPALKLVDRLAGSITIPKEFKGLSPDEMVKKAKKEYFTKRCRQTASGSQEAFPKSG